MITSIFDYSVINSFSNYKVTKNSFNNVIVYLENNIILGFLEYSVMYERAEIDYIFVREQYRNKKIATKLLSYVLDNINVDSISLEVRNDNFNAISLYKNFGFESVSIRKGYYQGIDGILMLKKVR